MVGSCLEMKGGCHGSVAGREAHGLPTPPSRVYGKATETVQRTALVSPQLQVLRLAHCSVLLLTLSTCM